MSCDAVGGLTPASSRPASRAADASRWADPGRGLRSEVRLSPVGPEHRRSSHQPPGSAMLVIERLLSRLATWRPASGPKARTVRSSGFSCYGLYAQRLTHNSRTQGHGVVCVFMYFTPKYTDARSTPSRPLAYRPGPEISSITINNEATFSFTHRCGPAARSPHLVGLCRWAPGSQSPSTPPSKLCGHQLLPRRDFHPIVITCLNLDTQT